MDLQRAKELLSGLADGVDPLTGEVFPEDHVCNKAEMIRAFHCVRKAFPGKASKPQPENAGKPWNLSLIHISAIRLATYLLFPVPEKYKIISKSPHNGQFHAE